LTQLEISLRQIPIQAERNLQQIQAVTQLQLGGTVRDLRDRLMQELTAVRMSGSLPGLAALVTEVAQSLTPSQIDVVVASLPIAPDRALIASLLHQVAQQEANSWGDLAEVSRRAYVTSGLPLIVDGQGEIEVEASAALLSLLIAVEVVNDKAQVYGTANLRKLVQADVELRRNALKKTSESLPEQEEWQKSRAILAKDPEAAADPVLTLTEFGIQATQVAEFCTQALKQLLWSNLLTGIITLPPQIVMEVILLLFSDPMFILVESGFESMSVARRVELVVDLLMQVQTVPAPEHIQQSAAQVIAQTDHLLRPWMAKQLQITADALDPQLRNDWLNQMGQQLNLWNPLQFFDGLLNRIWLGSAAQKMQELQERYPGLAVARQYGAAVQRANAVDRLMEQAQILRAEVKGLVT
jgi:hypothetical protein